MISFIIFNGEGISTILENIGGLFKFVSIPLITNDTIENYTTYNFETIKTRKSI